MNFGTMDDRKRSTMQTQGRPGAIRRGALIVLAVLLWAAWLPCFGFHSARAENQETNLQTVSRMKLTFTIDGRDIVAYYTGAVVDNHPYGEGIFEFADAHGTWTFAGSLQNGAFGDGIMTDYPYTMSFADENSYSRYTGPVSNGVPSGTGTYTIVTNGKTVTVLEGQFDDQRRFSGHASNIVMSFAYNGVTFSGYYTGDYKNGQADGNGRFESSSALNHNGLFFNYDGEWTQGGIVGPGELHTNNAQLAINNAMVRAEYAGHLEKGSFNGQGTISVNREGSKYSYSGNWVNNVYSGEGTLSVSGDNMIGYTYQGAWKNGLYDGQGSLIYDNRNIIKYIGNFEEGRFRPSFTELIRCLCSADNSKLELADFTVQYLEKEETSFTAHKRVENDPDFSYKDFSADPSEKNSKNFSAIIQIWQIREYEEDVFGYPVTEFIGFARSGNIYYGYYIGLFEGLRSGDIVKITAYPIGYSSYRSQEGYEIYTLRFLAYQVTELD